MWDKMLDLLRFSCLHRRVTTPFSTDVARQSPTFVNHPEEIPAHCSHYVVCLDCGRRFGYDWEEMRIIKQRLDRAG